MKSSEIKFYAITLEVESVSQRGDTHDTLIAFQGNKEYCINKLDSEATRHREEGHAITRNSGRGNETLTAQSDGLFFRYKMHLVTLDAHF